MTKKNTTKKVSKKRGQSKKATERPEEDGKVMNRGLGAAKVAKKDEFYTQYIDIQKEVEAYLEFNPNTFRDKVVYCNCDDPFESNFFKFFAANFNRLGLKKLITTSYDGSPIAGEQLDLIEYKGKKDKRIKPKAIALEIQEVRDFNGDGAVGIDDIEVFLKKNPHSRKSLEEGGDFRSSECVEILKKADIVVTNPPFSLFKEYVAQLAKYKKKFLIIGNTNSITYLEIFPLIKENKIWLGCTNFNVGMFFEVPDNWERFHHIDKRTGKKMARVSASCWFTNLDHGRRHEPLSLMTMEDNLKFSKNLKGKLAYYKYENLDALEVGTYKEIPSNYDGIMGVPVTFLNKYNPDQFEIIGNSDDSSMMEELGVSTLGHDFIAAYRARGGTGHYSPGMRMLCLLEPQPRVIYKRILIRHRHQQSKGKKK
ncbi:adenine-specific methyltransferase EcoRI family protein [Aestuariirhabdus litorea]|uniref:DNA methyltransferase n=1 Tax=Aestuariirhabdus litorea TaxID=2528527 RepID=A0A3P3VT51_9GAMM|nr:adenine-specific methyltransferase EcoRI family protein [Aestuariirhabdus litorea]RRJ83943.1 DNA methyltransferase [Aestuariirhabdus litorea]RWW97164.1 DNA methyltransferase [Endozoicomonadaceae bacterium GTF-13]